MRHRKNRKLNPRVQAFTGLFAIPALGVITGTEFFSADTSPPIGFLIFWYGALVLAFAGCIWTLTRRPKQ